MNQPWIYMFQASWILKDVNTEGAETERPPLAVYSMLVTEVGQREKSCENRRIEAVETHLIFSPVTVIFLH